MARVLITSTAPGDDSYRAYEHDELNRMLASAKHDRFGEHVLVQTGEKADVILFVDNCSTVQHYLEVRVNKLYRSYPERCFLYCKYDFPIPFLPGVYPSVEKEWYNRQRVRSGPYLKAFDSESAKYFPELGARDLLYSFMGASTNHPVRQCIFELDYNSHYTYDSSKLYPYTDLSDAERAGFKKRYIDTCMRSKFILCPRGLGASSIRLFEVMRMGRAPVIISDSWVAPEGPDWDAFSIRIPESMIVEIPEILEQRAGQAEEMGRVARIAWENWFSRETAFHHIVNSCLDIQSTRGLPEAVLRYSVFPQLLRPVHLKEVARVARRMIMT